MYLIISNRNQAVNDFVKKKKVFLKGSTVFKKKVHYAFLLVDCIPVRDSKSSRDRLKK